MKSKLIWEIIKNFGRLLSWDFWKQALNNRDFPAKLFIKAILLAAAVDILLMILRPGYPGEE